MKSPNPVRSQEGIALILVLWMLVLLTLIAGGLVQTSRTETVQTRNQIALARLQAIADGVVHRGIYEFLKPGVDLEAAWKPDGLPRELELDGVPVELTVTEETAFIDLNRAPDALLRGLLLSVGVATDEADRLVDAIADWRDPDELVRTNGAERDQYEAAGMIYAPSNEPFQSVEEVLRVLGMSRAIYQQIEAALTVHSGQPGINSLVAPRQVLLALPNATPEDVETYIEQRHALLAENQAVSPFPPATGYSSGGSGQVGVYNFKAIARLPDNMFFVRNAVVRLTRQPRQPFVLLDWKEGSL
ncbi:MAG: general secretion pathway protein GspK [Hydrogenophilales bacterium]|nr:general secretion pathway protein GspK [Hydrogenophilales bacterium]